MNNVEHSFSLDLQMIQSQISLEVNSGDTARRLIIHLTNGSKAHKLAQGSMAVLSGKKSNGKYLFNKCKIVDDDNSSIIQYDFTNATTDTPGVMQCEILIADPTESCILSPRFTMYVDTEVNGSEVFSEDENTFITQAIAQESARAASEETRTANEEIRQSNETARQEAESGRNKRLDAIEHQMTSLKNLNSQFERIEYRVTSLENVASGNIYETVWLDDNGTVFQVLNAMKYGILSKVGGRVKRISVDKILDLEKAITYGKENANYIYFENGTVIMPEGRKYYIKIPCELPAGLTIKVTARGNNSEGDRWYDYSTGEDATRKLLGETVTLEEAIKEIWIWKSIPGTATKAPLPLTDVLVTVSDPTLVVTPTSWTPLHEFRIPDEISNLDGYGEDGGYLDFSERKLYRAGSTVDVSAYLDENSDIITLAPGAIIRFYGEDGELISATYSFDYKNKFIIGE